MKMKAGVIAPMALAFPILGAVSMTTQASEMSFFVTSAGPGRGADLGGLAGADRHCQSLAKAAGAGDRVWRAYLSTSGGSGVNARDRIGKGPWKNAKGVEVAKSVEDLHSDGNKLNKQTALTEKGAVVNGRGDKPNMHDMLTGSQPDGRAFPADKDTTCRNWTTSGEGAAIVGHHDRQGLRDDAPSKSWNSSHPSRASKAGDPGCSQKALQGTGGNGLFYCFAAN